MTLTAVIVPVRNKLALTRQCLDSLAAALGERTDVELIVVDDGSTDETPAFLEQANVRSVRHPTSQGFAASCNDGAGATSEDVDYLIFLNNDTLAEDGWLDALVSYAESNTQAAIVGARLLYPNRTIQHAGIVFGKDMIPRHVYRGFPSEHPAVSKPRRLQAVTAACMLVRRTVFDEIDGFDVGFVNGFDDVDLCLRVAERGWEAHYCPDSVVVHLEAATRGDDAELFRENAKRFLDRWRERVRRDDLEIYAHDSLLELVPGDVYPLVLRVDPRLATPEEGDIYEVLDERSRQAFDLLKENGALRVRLAETSSSTKSPLAGGEETVNKPERAR